MKGKDLKNSILQMAVQGKLVPQNPNDEPASVLLERIREQQRQLVSEGKIKAPKDGESVIYRSSDGKHYEKRVDAKGHESDPVCIEGEIPFEIPDSWEWVRLNQLAWFGGGHTPSTSDKDNYTSKGILWVTSKDMKRDYIDDTQIQLTEKGAEKLYRYQPGTVLMVTRSGILRKLLPVAMLAKEATVNQDQKAIVPFLLDISDWIMTYLKANDAYIRKEFGKSGTTVESVVFDLVKAMPIAIPPLQEQHRISKKYVSSHALIQQYDSLETVREQLDAEFPIRLRKSILQAAVQGKLVPQDPSDEPASVLLERIREQRRQLIAEGKLKASKGGESVIYRASDGGYYEKRIDAKGRGSEPICIDDEIPFAIPENWTWSRLGSLCNYGQCTSIEYSDIADGVWVLELEKVERDTGSVIEKIRKHGGSGGVKHVFHKGNVLYSKLRPYLNKVVIADEDGIATSEIFPLDFLNMIDAHYAQLVLMSPFFLDYADSCSYGVKMPRLGTKDGQDALFPVPPKEEQERIIKLVNSALPIATN